MPSSKPRRGPPPPDYSRRASRNAARVAVVAASAGAVTAADASADMPYLSQGSHGAEVAKVQRALHVRAYGKFTKDTRRAVIQFQRHGGLLVDGIVGPQTWDALFHITPPVTTTPSSSSYSSSYSGSSSPSSGGYSIPSSVVQCESGGNYSAVNSSSGAGGAYQILPSTWALYGGHGAPQDAPKAEQDAIAAKIWAASGPSAWACG